MEEGVVSDSEVEDLTTVEGVEFDCSDDGLTWLACVFSVC